MFCKGAACNCFCFLLFLLLNTESGFASIIYLIQVNFSLYHMRKEKKKEEGERREKVDQETWKKKCGVSYVLLSVDSKVYQSYICYCEQNTGICISETMLV